LAELELEEAIEYYDRQSPGLGRRFFHEVSAAIERIQFMPEAWTRVGKETRKIIVKGFPYSLLYQIEEADDELVVTAVAHHHRNPERFQNRIQ